MQVFLNSIVLVCIISWVIILFYSFFKILSKKRIKLFFTLVTILHFVASIVFFKSLHKFPQNDATNFYINAVEANSWGSLFNLGSTFISFLIYPLAKIGITMEVLFILFSAISYFGCIVYFKLLDINNLKNRSTWFLLFFLIPSLHFWTGYIGKEALLFVLMAGILKNISIKNYNWQLVSLFLLVFLIRPHAFFILLFSFLIVILFDPTISKIIKRNLSFLTLGFLMILVPISAMFFLKVDNLNIESLQKYYSEFMNYTINKGSTSINLADTTIFSRIWYLLLMPLPLMYESKNIFQTVVSFEGVYFLVIIGYFIYIYFQKKISFQGLSNGLKFAFICGILLIILFGSYLYNLGLGNRMRVMFYPYLFYFFIMAVNLYDEEKNN